MLRSHQKNGTKKNLPVCTFMWPVMLHILRTQIPCTCTECKLYTSMYCTYAERVEQRPSERRKREAKKTKICYCFKLILIKVRFGSNVNCDAVRPIAQYSTSAWVKCVLLGCLVVFSCFFFVFVSRFMCFFPSLTVFFVAIVNVLLNMPRYTLRDPNKEQKECSRYNMRWKTTKLALHLSLSDRFIVHCIFSC